LSFLFEEKRECLGLLPQGKAEGRDSIRMKVFGERGMGFGEGGKNLSPERFFPPSPIFPNPMITLTTGGFHDPARQAVCLEALPQLS
jgi:hypothetical protein